MPLHGATRLGGGEVWSQLISARIAGLCTPTSQLQQAGPGLPHDGWTGFQKNKQKMGKVLVLSHLHTLALGQRSCQTSPILKSRETDPLPEEAQLLCHIAKDTETKSNRWGHLGMQFASFMKGCRAFYELIHDQEFLLSLSTPAVHAYILGILNFLLTMNP